MRTTITLDSDVAARLERAARERGISFKEAVNSALRRGFEAELHREERRPFELRDFDTGATLAGIDVDRVDELLDVIEGPWRK
ncbi:MAG: ribbon-helix-helix protein, CopG family [Candidatus Eremiobacteraeota bacterium]|nr:ribbon-helix-helix protein, CopG family [Candidatus Eremiobacteraeota bacterium]MBC5802505.1 ribbon-helix-helix protein, CopG family [Candidatus Eremiobacteraeota bacterium]MBC5821607.1 ribbon-helix-helix protein, CopG family [Candidatus Eremiobacteraeota bacterium]